MSTDRQRDAETDRLLRARLRPDPALDPRECPDAGMMAAYVDGGLPDGERATLDAHYAACGSCQRALATLARIDPVPPGQPARQPWLWRGHLHWLIPVSAATALVLYIAVRPAIAPTTLPQPEPASQAASVPASPQPAADVAGGLAKDATPETRMSSLAPVPQPSKSFEKEQPEAPAQMTLAQTQAAPAQAPGHPPAALAVAPAEGTPARREADLKEASEAVAPVPAPAAVTAPAFASATKPAVEEKQAIAPGVTADAATEPSPHVLNRDLGQAAEAAHSPIVVVSPDGNVRWRLEKSGGIFRSADRGVAWYAQKSGVTADLLAGSAPSATTCWAVGAAGTVMLTDDGERWERRPFPVRVDLVGVDAASSHRATVTARDGGRFTTEDGGRTWIRQ